jgi:hypothetical protein
MTLYQRCISGEWYDGPSLLASMLAFVDAYGIRVTGFRGTTMTIGIPIPRLVSSKVSIDLFVPQRLLEDFYYANGSAVLGRRPDIEELSKFVSFANDAFTANLVNDHLRQREQTRVMNGGPSLRSSLLFAYTGAYSEVLSEPMFELHELELAELTR